MDQFKDSIDASMQKLKTVLSQEGMSEFKSAMQIGKGKELSEEIVNTIVHEIENFLIHIANCKIDQISGRIEEKLANLGQAGFSLSDEQIENITKSIVDSEEFQKLNRGFELLTQNLKSGTVDQTVSDKTADNESIQNSDEAAVADTEKDKDQTPVEKIVEVLNNINKDKRLNDFKDYLTSLGGQSVGFSIFGNKLKAKTLEKILPKVKFLQVFYDKIHNAIYKATESTFQLGRKLTNLTKSFIKIGTKMLKMSAAAIAANIALATSAAALVMSNIALKTALITTAASNITLAASNITLAASNIALALTNIILAVTTLISLITITVTLLTAIISIFATVIIATVSIITAVVVAAFSVMATVIAMSIAIAASVLALAIAIAAVVLVLSAAIIAVTAIVMAAITVISFLITASVLAASALLAFSILFISTLLSAAILIITAAIGIFGTAMLMLFAFFTFILTAFSMAISGVMLAIASGIAILTVAAIAGISILLAAGLAIIAGIAVAAITFAGIALTTAIMAVVATLSGIILGLLLIFLFLYFCILEGIEKLIDWIKNTSIYKWWTEEVEPAGGLWEYIKAKFHEKFGWFEQMKDENGGWLGAIWNVIFGWWTGDKDGGGIWDWIWGKIKGAWEWASDFTSWLWEKIKSGFESAWGWLSNLGQAMKDAMTNWWLQSGLRAIIKKIADFVGIEMSDPPPANWPKPADLETSVPAAPPPVNDVIKENLLYVKQVRSATDLKWLKDQLNIWSSSDALEKAAGDETIKKIFESKVNALKRRIAELEKEDGSKEQNIAVQVGEQTGKSMDSIEEEQDKTQEQIEAAAQDIQHETEEENKKRDQQVERRGEAVKGAEQRVEQNQKQSAEKQPIPYAVPYNEDSLQSENK